MVVVMALTAVPLCDFVGLEFSMSVKSDAANYSYYMYTVANDEAKITSCTTDLSGEVIIPKTLGGYPVTSFGNEAFTSAGPITSLTIPDTVVSIGYEAFHGCFSLTNIIVSEKNKNFSSMDGVLFNKDKTKLIQYPIGNNRKKYIIPDSVTEIDYDAFENCWNLMSVDIGKSVSVIGDSAFEGCKNLTSVTMSDSVTVMGRATFRNCSNLPSITIPGSVTRIEKSTFENCSNLTSIIIPDSVKCIEDYAFDYCGSLKDVYYTGSKEQWENTMGKSDLTKIATIHYNYKPCLHTLKTTTTEATTSKDGAIVTSCTICKAVTETVVVPKISHFDLSGTKYTYSGKVITPAVTVKDSKGKKLRNGTDYTLTYAPGRKTPGKYSVTVNLKGVYSGSKTLYFTILPGKTSKLTATQTASSVKATWKAVTGADGYKVTLYSAKNKAVKTVYTTKTSYTFSKLSKGTTYKVRVTAYKTIDGKKVYAGGYTQLTTATKPGTPSLTVSAGTKKASLRWNKQTGASGYVVYMATSKNGKFSKIATLKGNSKISFTKMGLTKGKTYYFKVAAYSTVSGKTLYGSYSLVKAVKVK